MVDVTDKPETHRSATAEGVLRMKPGTLEALRAGTTAKGDPLVVAQIAAIQAAKRTADLIPLCHPLPLSGIDVRLEIDESVPGLRATATVRVRGVTGVEMEALTAVSVALLTAYDMLKAVEKSMQIDAIRQVEKSGGKSGDYQASESRTP
jgi:cyclic pyranopterin phosphate synthase